MRVKQDKSKENNLKRQKNDNKDEIYQLTSKEPCTYARHEGLQVCYAMREDSEEKEPLSLLKTENREKPEDFISVLGLETSSR